MSGTLGIIFAHEKFESMRELTAKRTCASVPFGARYRLVDFTISSMISSGIKSVGVITQSSYYSLMEHLGSGKEWDLNRKRGGLSILPPSFLETPQSFLQSSKIALLMGVMEYIKKSDCEYVLLSDSNIVANIDYREILNEHKKTNAYMTALYKSNVFEAEKFKTSPFIETGDSERIVDVAINQGIALHDKMLLGVYVIEKKLLEFLIHQCVAHNKLDFEKDILQEMCTTLDIRGFEHTGYAEKADSVSSFFKTNMDLLKSDVRGELFETERKIITKVHDEVPSFFGAYSDIENCLLADGCIIDGSVRDSVVFRNVKIGKGAKIKNCILMQDCEIGENAELSYCIIDKLSNISNGTVLRGAKEYPIILPVGHKV